MDLLKQIEGDRVFLGMLKNMHHMAATINQEAFTNIVYGDRSDKPDCVCSLKFGGQIKFGSTHSVRSTRSTRGRIATVHTHNGVPPQPPSVRDLAINLEQSNNEPETYVPTVVVDGTGVWFLYVMRKFIDLVNENDRVGTVVCETYAHALKSQSSARNLSSCLRDFGILLRFIPFESYL